MATHDYVIDNSTGANVRADINNVLQAILTNNSSSSAPSTTAAYMFWADTTNGVLKIRNSSDNAWIELFQLDGTLTLEAGSASTPALAFRSDLNTGIYQDTSDEFNIATGGTERLSLGSSNTIFNETGADVDFRVEGVNEANLFYIDAGNRRIGIITSSPSDELHIKESKSGDVAAQIENTSTNNSARARLQLSSDSASLQLYATAAVYDGVSSWPDSGVITTGSGAAGGLVLNVTAAANMKFQIQQSEKMRLDPSGRLMIGTTTEGGQFADDLTIANSGHTGITIRSGTDSVGSLYFSDGTSGDDEYRGAVQYNHTGNFLRFYSDATERIRIDSSGNVGIGTSSPDTMLHLKSNGVSTIRLTDNDTTAENDQMIGKIEFETRDSNATGIGADILTEITDTTSSACALFLRTGTPSTLGTRLMVHSGGKLTATGVYNGITTGGSPVYVESDGDLLRFTSSSKYKTDIETLEDTRADNILNCRPVWYKSTCANDIKTEGATKSDWGWYGFIAEEVATVDPRLVSWATKDSVETEGSANNKSVERDPSKYTAEGCQI